MTKRSTAPARAFAVIALIGGFILLVVVFSAALSGGDSDDGGTKSPTTRTTQQQKGGEDAPKSYVIENGDTLIAIAHKTGVPVGQIERLNPEVDPQILISGEKLKLR
jgi:LysM repeat protein